MFLQLSRAPAVADVHLHVQPGPVEPRVDEADEALRRLLIGALGRVLAGRAVAEAREVDAVDVDALPAVTLRVSDHRLDPRTLIATVSHIHDRVAARVGALVVVEDRAPAALLVCRYHDGFALRQRMPAAGSPFGPACHEQECAPL